MLKSKLILITAISALILTSCFSTSVEQNSTKEVDSEGTKITNVESNSDSNVQTTNAHEPFLFDCNLNVLQKNITINNVLSVSKEETDLTLLTNVTPDKSMTDKNAVMRIFLIEDGEPITFSVNNSDNYMIQNDVITDINKDTYTDIRFKPSESFSILTVVCVFYPENIPALGLGEYSGEISYSIVNSNYDNISKKITADSQNYIDMPEGNRDYSIDVGIKTIESNDYSIADLHFSKDVTLKKNEPLYLKFNSGESGTKYYLMLLIDGKLVKAFDGKYCDCVDCKKGSKSVQYQLSYEIIPKQNGLHLFHLIAVPKDRSDNMSSYSSSKIRINIDR